nr:MAG TPA: hypothetical protein [Caudoviricetes sp.]
MAKWNEYGLKSGTSAEDEVLILDSDTNTNKRTTVGDIQEFANGKVLEKENSTLNTEAKDLIGAINEVDAKNDEQDTKIEEVENKFSDYLKKTDVDRTLSLSGSPADAKVVGEQFEKSEEAITDLTDKKITKFYASSQGNTNLPDSDKGKIQDMFLYGKSEQVQYKGVNKLTLRDAQQINTGIECKVVDSKLQFKGTATSTYCTFDAKEVTISAGTKITAYTDSTKDWFIWLRDSDNKLYALNKSVKTATYDKDVTLKQFGLQNYQSGDSINMTVDFGLMVGSDDYEPYTGGIPSPNPDYPQEIKAVVNPKVVVRGKNLLSQDWLEHGSNSDGIDIGTNKRLRTKIEHNLKVKLGEKYTISADKMKVVSVLSYVNGVYSNDSAVTDESWRTLPYSFTVSKDAELRFIFAENKSSAIDVPDINLLDFGYIQIEKGSTVTPYEPYTEQSTTLPYTLYAIPVTTGGNITIGGKQYVADYVDVERGKLVRKCLAENIKLSNANFEIENNTQKVALVLNALSKPILGGKNNGIIISDKFIYAKNNQLYPTGIYHIVPGISDGVGLRISVPPSFALDDVNKIRTFICGILVTPEEIDLTLEQIQAFKSLSTNYPVTNMEVSSDQLDGYTVFNYPISMAEGWNYVKQQIGDTRDYIYDMDLQSAEAYVNSEYAVALAELEVM